MHTYIHAVLHRPLEDGTPISRMMRKSLEKSFASGASCNNSCQDQSVRSDVNDSSCNDESCNNSYNDKPQAQDSGADNSDHSLSDQNDEEEEEQRESASLQKEALDHSVHEQNEDHHHHEQQQQSEDECDASCEKVLDHSVNSVGEDNGGEDAHRRSLSVGNSMHAGEGGQHDLLDRCV